MAAAQAQRPAWVTHPGASYCGLLCRPVGFVDRHETRVLVATESSLAAQETQLRTRELVYRLQKLDDFARVSAVRVVVDARAFRGLDDA